LISPRAGLIVWTASADFEVAFDAPVDDPRYGQFTHAWADAVKTKPNASIASVRLQLLDAAKQFCRDLALKHHACTSLTPGIFAIEAIWQLPISGVLGTREPWESLSGRNIEFVIEELQNDSGRSAEVSIALRDMYGQDRTDFTSGEPMKLKIQTDLEGHLTLFALAGDNQLIRIFPLNSEDQERDWVEPRLQNVFENFQAKGSPANYKLVALVTKERLDQNERITRGGADWGDTPPKRPGSQALPVLPAPPASAAVADLLTQIINREGSGGGDFGRWGFAVAKLKIVEQLGR